MKQQIPYLGNALRPPRPNIAEWLADPGRTISIDGRSKLTERLLSCPSAIVMGTVNCLLIDLVALFLDYHLCFMVFAVCEIVCCIVRVAVIRAISRERDAGGDLRINGAVWMSILWCGLQGLTAFVLMRSNIHVLQILTSIMTMGMIGPICSRNYPAPRLAFLLVCLCDLPFVGGACTSGNLWLLVTAPMTPPFLYGTRGIIQNIHQMAISSLNSELASKKLACSDPLTGLLNRYGFHELSKAVSSKMQDTSLFCLDLDGFKQVNDRFGHHAGDALLQAVALRLKSCVRPGDAVVRLGGDEFIVFKKNMPESVANAFAQTLIEQIACDAYRLCDHPPIRIGASVGFACCPDDAACIDELHRKADAACYAAKAAGKGVRRRAGPKVDRNVVESLSMSA